MGAEKEPRVVRVENPGERFWEQVDINGEYRYACYQPPRDYHPEPRELIDFQSFMVGPVDEDKAVHYVPLRAVPWPLAGEPQEPGPDIWTEVHGYIWRHVDLPDDRLYDVLTSWVFATWIPEAWVVVPYLQFLGPKHSGKTRLQDVLKQVCYRGTLTANISEAALFRLTEAYRPTLLLDETEIYSNERRAAIQNLLNAGYRRGQHVIRVGGMEEGQPRLELFDVFGFKSFSGTNEFKDTLESRAILIVMEKNIRPVEFVVDERTAKDLRSRLLLWRFRRLADITDTTGIFWEEAPRELSFADGRFVELYASLLTVANHGHASILSYARDAYEAMQDEESSGIETQIITAVLKTYPYLENGKFSTASVREAFNEDRPEKERWGSNSIGRLLKRLGFRPKRMADSTRRWIWDKNRIDRLCKRYGVTPLQTSVVSETPISQELEDHPLCIDCNLPINDGSNIVWRDGARLCSRCAGVRRKIRGV